MRRLAAQSGLTKSCLALGALSAASQTNVFTVLSFGDTIMASK